MFVGSKVVKGFTLNLCLLRTYAIWTHSSTEKLLQADRWNESSQYNVIINVKACNKHNKPLVGL